MEPSNSTNSSPSKTKFIEEIVGVLTTKTYGDIVVFGGAVREIERRKADKSYQIQTDDIDVYSIEMQNKIVSTRYNRERIDFHTRHYKSYQMCRWKAEEIVLHLKTLNRYVFTGDKLDFEIKEKTIDLLYNLSVCAWEIYVRGRGHYIKIDFCVLTDLGMFPVHININSLAYIPTYETIHSRVCQKYECKIRPQLPNKIKDTDKFYETTMDDISKGRFRILSKLKITDSLEKYGHSDSQIMLKSALSYCKAMKRIYSLIKRGWTPVEFDRELHTLELKSKCCESTKKVKEWIPKIQKLLNAELRRDRMWHKCPYCKNDLKL